MITSTQLAEELNVSKSAISKALARGTKCAGLEICELAITDENGKVLGFDYESPTSEKPFNEQAEAVLETSQNEQSECDEVSNQEHSSVQLNPIFYQLTKSTEPQQVEPQLTSTVNVDVDVNSVEFQAETIDNTQQYAEKMGNFYTIPTIKDAAENEVDKKEELTLKSGNTAKLATKSARQHHVNSAFSSQNFSKKDLFYALVVVGIYRKVEPSIISLVKSTIHKVQASMKITAVNSFQPQKPQ